MHAIEKIVFFHKIDNISSSFSGLMNFKLIETTGNAPPPRSWHGSTLTRENQSIIIHGGYNGEKALNDVYMLKLSEFSFIYR